MRKVSIYIEETRESGNYSELELFKDEEININLSVQNVKDISKVFTDFTQSFTVPASSVNNALLRHYYENAVDLDPAEWDNRLRINAYIEINRTPFRNGKVEIEKANIVKGRVESYTITFYGTLVNLKDTFGENYLSELDLTNISSPYSYSDVLNSIDSASNLDVRYPLISSSRIWSYGDNTSTDISKSVSAINYRELFPAVKVAKILESIENTYGINFNGLFLSDKRFTDLFLYCKNAENPTDVLGNQILQSVSDVYLYDDFNPSDPPILKCLTGSNEVLIDYNYVYNINYVTPDTAKSFFEVDYVDDVNATYTIEVYKNGGLWKQITGSGVGSYLIDTELVTKYSKKLTFRIRSTSQITIETSFYFEYLYYSQQVGKIGAYVNFLPITIGSNVNLNLVMPKIKVSDFVSGILKMFNLTCTAQNVDTFLIEPLDWWYSKGAIVDVTTYVDDTNIDIKKVPLYDSISFEYTKSKSILNDGFYQENRLDYGNLKETFEYNGDDFEVKVPFENIHFNKFTGQDLQVSYCLDIDYKKYVPEPILLYMYETKTNSGVYFTDGTTTDIKTSIKNFGQDLYYNSNNYSLNFNAETSSLLNLAIDGGLYKTWYYSYIENLYTYKNRLTYVKCIFPVSLITSLKLNDRLIIRDKRYTINTISSNLNTGEVQLELLNDFRLIANGNNFNVPYQGGTAVLPIMIGNNVQSIGLSTTAAGVTFSATTITEDTNITVTYPDNPNVKKDIVSEDSSFNLISENGIQIINEEADNVAIDIIQTSTLQNGDTTVNTIYIIQDIE